MGYEAYRKRLIETGRYRGAEQDKWPDLREKMRKEKDAARAGKEKKSGADDRARRSA
ncbi:MAG: hypothetical protein NTW86_08935 [Candidatus Sumerlaeota bacterium]|nr:hypothetical protein [Candidatus Sumerlaeota bacterium]